MFCTNCGSQFEDGNVFCPNCGTKVESIAQKVEEPAPVAQPIAEPVPVAAPVEAAPVAAIPVAAAAPVEPAYQAAPAPAPAPQAVPVAPVQPVYAQPATPVAPVGMGMGANNPELAKNILILGIVAVALACSFYFSIGGIICGAIGLSKSKKFIEECGQLFGKAKIGKYLSLGGLIGGCVLGAIAVFYIGLIVLAAIAEGIG